jgi:N-carbamoylputrescine amidase
VRVTVCELHDDRRAFAADWTALVDHARSSASDLVLLPEMPFAPWLAASPRFDADAWRAAVEAHDRWIERLAELAPAVVIGSRPVIRNGRRLNEGFMWSRSGGYAPIHDKRHLPDEEGYFEAKWYEPGDGTFTLATLPRHAESQFGSCRDVRLGLLICTELWSLGQAQRYGRAGADLVATPRATGRATVDKWIVGGRAAAIVGGTFSISSNWTASPDGGDFGGGAWIVDPDGDVMVRTTGDAPFATRALDLDRARSAKQTYPRYALE